MARGTVNTLANLVAGSPLTPGAVNDGTTILSSADDDALYEMLKTEPPPGASLTNVNTFFAPLRDGPAVTTVAAGHGVTVAPLRAIRSSTSNALPRSVVSAVTTAATALALPAEPAAGLWGWEMLVAQITFVDPSNPTKGAVCTFIWGTSPAYAAFAAAGVYATKPVDTNTSWNVPIAWVRNYAGQTGAMATRDIVEIAPGVDAILASGYTPVRDRQARLTTQRSGVDARRAYSSAQNDPTQIVLGGPSLWVAAAVSGVLSKTVTPIVAGRRNVEYVRREITIPRCAAGSNLGTAGTAGVPIATLVLDDTRDWRGANFRTELWVPNIIVAQFGEEDPAVADPRVFPTHADTTATTASAAQYSSIGQSWTATLPHAIFGSKRWAAIFGNDADVAGIGSRNGVAPGYLAATTDGWGIFVDATTGNLTWFAKRAGALGGPPAWILLEAWFGNHLP